MVLNRSVSLPLDLVHQIIQAVPKALDTFQMSNRAVHLLQEGLAAHTLALYQVSTTRSLLHLLAQAPASSSFPQI
ncbi:MAG: hypothetical protein ACRDHW_11225, partial [Ktedonobacteraceae bacterium]